ncbi:MAG: ZIP family metal transporter [Bacteroidales bacterium]
MNLLVFSGLFFPILLFGLSVYLFRICNKNLKLLVAFSGAFLLSLTFNELIPHIFGGISAEGHSHGHIHEHESHLYFNINMMGLFVLAGFFIQLLLDYLTKGVEHGHLHSKCPAHESHLQGEPKYGISYIPVIIGLCLHSFLEAMPLAEGFSNDQIQKQLLLGIVIHNIPLSVVLMSLFIQNGLSRRKSVILLLIFALAGPAGVVSADFAGSYILQDMETFFKISMSLVVGIFLHISTTILFESDEDHRFNYKKLAVIVLGALIALIHF